MKRARIPLLILLVGLIILLYYQFDLTQYLNIEYLKGRQSSLISYYSAHHFITAIAFFLVCVILISLCLPVGGILMIASGVIFGWLWGTILVSFAHAIGSALAFLASRYLLKDIVSSLHMDKIDRINQGIARDGFFYLILIRQIPVFPSFLVNILMGMTSIGLGSFYLATQIGTLGFAVVFANAGTQIATISAPSDILSPRLILSFVLVGMFPLLAKNVLMYIRRRKQLAEIEPDILQ